MPGHDYEREVPKLVSKPNVTTIGYVRVDYCKKPLHDACEEIDRFAGWVTKHGSDVPGLSVDGIYVDETPNHCSAGRKLYLEALHKHIKGKDGLLGQRLVSSSRPISLVAILFLDLLSRFQPSHSLFPLQQGASLTGFACRSCTIQVRHQMLNSPVPRLWT